MAEHKITINYSSLPVVATFFDSTSSYLLNFNFTWNRTVTAVMSQTRKHTDSHHKQCKQITEDQKNQHFSSIQIPASVSRLSQRHPWAFPKHHLGMRRGRISSPASTGTSVVVGIGIACTVVAARTARRTEMSFILNRRIWVLTRYGGGWIRKSFLAWAVGGSEARRFCRRA